MTRFVSVDPATLPPANAPAATSGSGRLEPPLHNFVYLDCGLWAGSGDTDNGGPLYVPQRNFGLVHGRWVLLCEYLGPGVPETERPDDPDRGHFDDYFRRDRHAEGMRALSELLETLRDGPHRARVIARAYCHTVLPAAQEPNRDKIYVFLPDLHMPVVTAKTGYATGPVATGEALGRIQTYPSPEDDHPYLLPALATAIAPGLAPAIVPDLAPVQVTLEAWYRKYRAADIFQTAHEDLHRFARRLHAYAGRPGARRLHLVQLGDMIDLWVGLRRMFVPSDARGLFPTILDPATAAALTTWRFVKAWTDCALDAAGPARTRALRRAVEALVALPGDQTWLYGNHDCYFGLGLPSDNRLLPRRKRVLDREPGIFAEHGHRTDPSNRDGAPNGHFVTAGVFMEPRLRHADGTVAWALGDRATRLRGAAEHWTHKARRNAPFGIYVMAHTHEPMLEHIEVGPYVRPPVRAMR
ncbi:MAG: hypothetical protein HY908_20715 [Myxococcales bacterium]|nr:hypothetical protein [Myxococcales bacterium]